MDDAGAWYHVTVRANRREMLLDRGEVRDLFLIFHARAKKRYRFEVSNFCVMGNHLLLRPREGEDLSAIMRWLLGYFARAYNKKRGWTGHFGGDRFHSRVLNGLRDISLAFGYIDDNPVKAGLVSQAVALRHSGAWHSQHGGADCLDPAPMWLAFLAVTRSLPSGLA